jgi:hypothetical protein
VTVENFVVKDCWNTESWVIDQPFLNGVGEGLAFAWSFAFSLPRDLADTVLHHFRGFCGREVAAIGGEIRLRVDLRATRPQTRQLRDLFFERHSRQEIGDASFNG